MEVFSVIFVSHYQSAEVEQPGKKPFDFPTPHIATQRSSILCSTAPGSIGCNHLGAVIFHQALVEPVTVISLVSNQSFRHVGHDALVQCLLHQLHFRWRSALCPQGERKTMAVCNAQDLGALAAFGLPDQTPPFLAGTNVPSTKHSFKSNSPAFCRWSASTRSILSITPERTQFWNRRCTVWYAPYRGGRSCQGAPVLKIHMAPSNALRRSLHGRPRPSSRTTSAGRMLSTSFHCSSVKRIHTHCTLPLKVQELIYEMGSNLR